MSPYPGTVGDAITGRGDTVYAINKLGIAEKLDHASAPWRVPGKGRERDVTVA